MSKWFEILWAPFPSQSSYYSVFKVASAYGFFVAAFLSIFKPFGLSNFGDRAYYFAFLYGLVSLAVVSVLEMIKLQINKDEIRATRWLVWKEIGWTVLTISVIGVANAFLTHWIGLSALNGKLFLVFQLYTVAVGAIPIVISVLLRQKSLEKQHFHESEELNSELEKQHHPSPQNPQIINLENGKDVFQMDANAVLFIQAADNYIEILYQDAQSIKKALLRNTLSKAETALALNPHFFRCHKSYVVNLERVVHVTGNAQGCKLQMNGSEFEVPVSRNMIPELKTRLANHP